MAYHMYVFREGSSFGPTSTRPGVTCWQQELEREWKTSKLWGGCSLIQLDYDNVLAQPSILFLSWINKKQISSTKVFIFMSMQGRIKGGGQRWQLPRALRCKGAPRDEIYLFQIKYSFEKFRDSEAIQENNSILYSYVALSIKGSQQQLISLQVWLSANFSNPYWIACKYFRFCSMQIYFISLVTFS